MQRITGAMRHYPWGSTSLIAGMRGQEVPSPRPEAELWFGAHPAAPSLVDGQPLDQVIAADPQAALGSRVAQQFGNELPFLVKILAADEPLSMQAHPSAQQAVAGFERENAAGIPIDAPNRNYKDPSHKPEIIVALTDFEALGGFRPLDKTRELFDALNCPHLDRYVAMVSGAPEHEEGDLRVVFTTWITIPASTRTALVDGVVESAHRYLDDTPDGWIADALRAVISLNDRYPGDIGVLGALLLNHIKLRPGEAMHLDAGQLHAYLRGMGVEVMANSDNVLRGGLTSKYVDIPELVRVLEFRSLPNPRVVDEGGHYHVPIEEFHLEAHDGPVATVLDGDGPAIVLCTAGEVNVDKETLTAGEAMWIPASDPAVDIRGEAGAQVFITRA